jgi:hypothetical protein
MRRGTFPRSLGDFFFSRLLSLGCETPAIPLKLTDCALSDPEGRRTCTTRAHSCGSDIGPKSYRQDRRSPLVCPMPLGIPSSARRAEAGVPRPAAPSCRLSATASRGNWEPSVALMPVTGTSGDLAAGDMRVGVGPGWRTIPRHGRGGGPPEGRYTSAPCRCQRRFAEEEKR